MTPMSTFTRVPLRNLLRRLFGDVVSAAENSSNQTIMFNHLN